MDDRRIPLKAPAMLLAIGMLAELLVLACVERRVNDTRAPPHRAAGECAASDARKPAPAKRSPQLERCS